jgi:hypothetical protein
MDDQLPRVSALITERSPHVFCALCIARMLDTTEQEVREKLQVMVARRDLQRYFAVTRRLCFGCGVMGDHVGLRR